MERGKVGGNVGILLEEEFRIPLSLCCKERVIILFYLCSGSCLVSSSPPPPRFFRAATFVYATNLYLQLWIYYLLGQLIAQA